VAEARITPRNMLIATCNCKTRARAGKAEMGFLHEKAAPSIIVKSDHIS